ncbi:O(6)-methylguanine-induced apoptosis 2 [Ambystoma mexicanum]|uniref:O(6)-methylguanine-induced apoptosis 2 n=1 Tax=Ambystoma mexicanum TaxID=8296 RepID=UPI0037E7B7CE
MASGAECVLPHVSRKQGKLWKGCRMPTSTSSIPTKYQTVCIPNPERKGFNSQAQRFQYDANQNENPGPGFYDVIHKSAEITSASLSKKGTGYFPSKDSRMSRAKTANTPGANAYCIPQRLMSRTDFSTGYSSMFHRPIALKVEDWKNRTPGPNEYDVSSPCNRKSITQSAKSAFVSKTKRELQPLQPLGPSPCHYTINDSLMKGSPKTIMSSFKSKTLRDSWSVVSANPGPASYHPYETPEPAKKIIYPRGHYLCISAPAMPIPKTPPLPAPGQYEVVDFQGRCKQCISSAVFVSNTSRWAGDISAKGLPGPGAYDPQSRGKQSFHFNVDDRWIPA